MKAATSIIRFVVLGAVGFGIGAWAYQLLAHVIPTLGQLGEQGRFFINSTTIGTVGGASLGEALGYLEYRKLGQEQLWRHLFEARRAS